MDLTSIYLYTNMLNLAHLLTKTRLFSERIVTTLPRVRKRRANSAEFPVKVAGIPVNFSGYQWFPLKKDHLCRDPSAGNSAELSSFTHPKHLSRGWHSHPSQHKLDPFAIAHGIEVKSGESGHTVDGQNCRILTLHHSSVTLALCLGEGPSGV